MLYVSLTTLLFFFYFALHKKLTNNKFHAICKFKISAVSIKVGYFKTLFTIGEFNLLNAILAMLLLLIIFAVSNRNLQTSFAKLTYNMLYANLPYLLFLLSLLFRNRLG